MTSTTDFAIYYASRGFYVFPVGKDKKPLVDWDDLCTIDEKQIRQWWDKQYPQAGIGLVTGAKSGIVAMDIDPRHGGNESIIRLMVDWGELPVTAETVTGGGGRHIIFIHPGVHIGNKTNIPLPGLDFRGDGGYIVAPPSPHESGRRYEWAVGRKLSQTPLAPMPGWLTRLYLGPEPTQQEQQARIAAPVDKRIGAGARNQTLASLAGTMRRRGIGADAIFQALLVENNNKCDPPLSHDEVMAIAKSVGRYEPTAPPVFGTKIEQITGRDPLDAFGAGVAFMDLLENLAGRSIKTGIVKIDESLGGIERQTLTVLAARPSMGKSTLAWQAARNVATGGLKAYVFSLEMATASLWAKAACGAAGVRWRDIRNQTASEAQITAVLDWTSRLMNTYGECLLIDDGVNTTETIWQALEKHKPDLVVIDHLRLVADRGDKETKRLGMITQRMKEAAKAFNCGMLVLAQLNRGVEDRDNKRPTLADLRDSGEIEENADVVLMMHSDDYYEPTGKPKVLTEVLVRKFRDDVLNQRIVLSFDKAHQWFGADVDSLEAMSEWK